MYASIRRYHVNAGTADVVLKKWEEGLLPELKKTPGFIAYYALDTGGGIVASISIFDSLEGAENSNLKAVKWVAKNAPKLLPAPPEYVVGAIKVHAAK